MRCGIYIRVSTNDQRDNGYSIYSQLRMIKEYCGKNSYDIVDVYNDVGHSGKDLMRPEMQRLLKDIKSHRIEKIQHYKTGNVWLDEYIVKQDINLDDIIMQEEGFPVWNLQLLMK